jgi:hypothetical protein
VTIPARPILSLAALACCALSSTGCLSSTSTPESGSGSAAGTGGPSGSGSGANTGTGGAASGAPSTGSTASSGSAGSGASPSSSGTAGAGSSSSGPPAGTTAVLITPDANGFVGASSNSVGIQGSWYAYGDGWGANAAPPGDCETKGMHMTSECSSITFPPPAVSTEGGFVATFPQTVAGSMCLSGTAAKVIGTDYSDMFGIGIGLDLNNVGGAKMPFNATAANVVGFSFHIAGIPTGVTVSVELPIPATDPSGDSWARTVSSDGDYTIELSTTASAGALKPSFTMAMEPAFDATQIESIQFHIPTNTAAATTIPDSAQLCVSNFAALVKM